MADLKIQATSGEVSLLAATAKTVLMLKAAANHRDKLEGISISFKGAVPTDTPVRYRIIRPTTDGTSTAVTITKKDPSAGETIQSTAGKNFTVEPTAGDIVEEGEIHPQTGQKWFMPFGSEYKIPGGARLSVELTAAQAQTAVVTFDAEE
jgi:hypothetical protein